MQTVPVESTPAPTARNKSSVARSFDAVAHRYDLLQRFNPGYRKHLTLSAARLGARPDGRLLDLCCGTGLSTEALAERYPRAEITGLDGSPGMLKVARRKKALEHVHFVEGDAADPRAAGLRGPFDGIFMAYGIRNVDDPDACLATLYDLLEPGAPIVFHEYSVAGSAYSQLLWNAVSGSVIVPLGRALTGTDALFRYLRESVNEFDSVETFCARLRRAGFGSVSVHAMDSWQRGIVHTFRARRPA